MNARRWQNVTAVVTLVPAWAVVLFVYLGSIVWSIQISMTSSKIIPVNNFVGFDQYRRLFDTDRWQASVYNVILFGVLFVAICLILGFLLAVMLDQKIRFEGAFRTIFLYPHAMSFIVTGVIWQWLLSPTMGIEHSMHGWGFTAFSFDWLVNRDWVIYALVIAGVWQASGLVMVLMLAGLRGVDPELWKATRVDGIPAWRVYISIVLPLINPMVVTSVVLLAIGVVKSYDLVVALTGGGPGTASEVPGKFVMDYLFERQNIGLAMAASTIMLITVLSVLVPWLYFQYFRKPKNGRVA